MSLGFITKFLRKQTEAAPSRLDATGSQPTYDSVYRMQSAHAAELELKCFSCGNDVKLSTARYCLAREGRFKGQIFCNNCLSADNTAAK